MRVVVCDTGPLLHLSEIDRLGLLSAAGAVVIPPAVADELDRHIRGLDKPDWIRIDVLDIADAEQASAWEALGVLHAGEAQSLALARRIKCNWYLTDDTAARIFASSLGLEVHGTLGLVLWLAVSAFITRQETVSILDRLANESSLWISAQVLADARASLDELFS